MSAPRILVTRAPHQASALADRLRELGAEPVLFPTIETVEPTSFTALDEALTNLNTFHWLIFTSANAVGAFNRRQLALKEIGFKPSVTGSIRPQVAAIGPSTARALENIGLHTDLIPLRAIAESLTEVLLPLARQPDSAPTRFLLIRAEEARELLPETLRAAGAEVTIAPAYRTVIPKDAAQQIGEMMGTIDAITFTSSSTARNLFILLEAAGAHLPASLVRASIGPITSTALAEMGFPPHVESPEATVHSLAESLVKYLHVNVQR